MPLELEGNIKVMVLDDALEQESLENGALSTESGFQQYLVLKEEFKANIQKLIKTGVQAVFVDRGVDDAAAELLEEADFICYAVADAVEAGEPVRDGVQLEKNLYRLLPEPK